MLGMILISTQMDIPEKLEFEKIYYKYRNLLFTKALSLTGSEQDAEDVLQTAFIKIAKNIKHIKDAESKETVSFLVIILKNTAYDFLRKRRSYAEISLEEIENISVTDKAIEDIVSNMQYEKIVLSIKGIPSPYREVLYLHYVKDYSIKKTSDLLERKTATVKMQLVRGKKLLINKLSEVLYD